MEVIRKLNDLHEALTVAPAQSQVLREAEKVFQGLRGSAQTAPAESEPTTAAISSGSEAVAPRVLPDLRAATRQEERDDVRKPRRNDAANRSTEGQPRKKAPAKPAQVPAAATIIEAAPTTSSSGHAEAAMALSRGMSGPRTKLPPGQRWRSGGYRGCVGIVGPNHLMFANSRSHLLLTDTPCVLA